MNLYEKATSYLDKGDYTRAEKFYKKLLSINPSHPESCLNMGAILKGRSDLRGALRYFKIALAAKPNWSYPYNNIGLIYHNWGKEELAQEYFRKAIALEADYADAHWNLGLSLLKSGYSGRSGCLEEGWNEYTWRFKKSGPVKLAFKPDWQIGVTGRCLVVPEQGIGDYIMFSSCLEENMVVADLDRFKEISECLGVKTGRMDDEYDTWIPMGSLRGFKKVERVLSGGSGIGVCWSGNPEHGNDKFRSRRDVDFSWLKRYDTVTSFQYGKDSKVFGECCTTSWAQTMSKLLDLRLLVTVDTSIAHFAGWLGVPTCCLVPAIDTDFRWGLGRHDNEWYSSVYIARSIQECIDYVSSFPK